MGLKQAQIEKYLANKFGSEAKINEFKLLGKGVYGTTYLIDFKVGEENKKLVLKTMAKGGFGHDHFSDIASILIWENSVYNKLPKHIQSFDVVGADKSGNLKGIGELQDFYILVEEAVGTEYNHDLDKIQKEGLQDGDREKVVAMAEYLAEIHQQKKDSPELYVRRARDLVGHGEYIMGVLDGYPAESYLTDEKKADLVKKCVDWWAKLKGKTNRLCQVHGDFHPFNVLFKEGSEFIVLDRSRGEFGEPADDLASMAINYLFWALVKNGSFSGEFKELFDLFFKTYMDKTGDQEMLEVLGPYFAFRAFVVANPTFYPDKFFKEKGNDDPQGVRDKLIQFADTVLSIEKVNLDKIQEYCGE